MAYVQYGQQHNATQQYGAFNQGGFNQGMQASQFNQGAQYGQGTQRQSNPFWYRENASYLAGVTGAPSNMAFGIQNIKLNQSSPAQQQYGILVNGVLTTVVGTISFQIRLSKSGAPFVQTISTKVEDSNGQGQDRYWEHIMLNPQVKAQILRHFEVASGGGMQQPQGFTQPQYQATQFNQGVPQYQAPQANQGVPQYQGMPGQQVASAMMYPQFQQPVQELNTEEAGVDVPESTTQEEANSSPSEEKVPSNVDVETGEIIGDDLPV